MTSGFARMVVVLVIKMMKVMAVTVVIVLMLMMAMVAVVVVMLVLPSGDDVNDGDDGDYDDDDDDAGGDDDVGVDEEEEHNDYGDHDDDDDKDDDSDDEKERRNAVRPREHLNIGLFSAAAVRRDNLRLMFHFGVAGGISAIMCHMALAVAPQSDTERSVSRCVGLACGPSVDWRCGAAIKALVGVAAGARRGDQCRRAYAVLQPDDLSP